MNVETTKMTEYADFLAENSRKIVNLCTKIEETLILAQVAFFGGNYHGIRC